MISKIIIFGYNNYERITTSKYLEGVKHTLLVHTDEQKRNFIQSGNLSKDAKVIVSGNPKGLAYNRNFALEKLMNKGEWAMFWVDDLVSVTWNGKAIRKGLDKIPVSMANQNKYRKDFKEVLHAKDFIKHCNELTKKAGKEGISLIGFSSTNNPLFRPKRFKYFSYIDGRCYLIKKTHLRFDEKCQSMDDVFISAAHLKEFGKVLLDSWVLPECTRFRKGISHGSKEDRIKNKLKQTFYLLKKFPGLIHIEPRKSAVGGLHVKIKLKS